MKTLRMRSVRMAAVAVAMVAGLAMSGEAGAQSMFTHQIPLKLPKGVNGMQPELSLVYYPGSGNGILGVGWQLSGLSSITRVNYGNGINYDGNDTYAHSQLGVLVKQADGTYRTKKESFTRFVPTGGICGDAPCSWIAHDRSGARFYYGVTTGGATSSALTLNGFSNRRTWGLAQAVDLFGNSYDVSYSRDLVNGQLYPLVITYTRGQGLTAYRTVEFGYATGRADTEPGYRDGYVSATTRRLTTITVKSRGLRLRKYQLVYGESGAVTGRSHLTEVREYGSDDTALLPAQRFQWQQGGAGVAFDGVWDSGQGGVRQKEQWFEGDYNGDGAADLAYLFDDSGNISIDVHQSTGSGFSMLRWISRAGSWMDLPHPGVFLPGDFDGDGKSDLAYAFENGDGKIVMDVYRSTGSGFLQERWRNAPAGIWMDISRFLPGDFNGDGKTDVAFLFNNDGKVTTDVWLSTGSGFTVNQRWATKTSQWRDKAWAIPADLDGDGRTDIAYVFNEMIWSGGSFPTQGRYLLVDLHLSTGTAFTHERWSADFSDTFDPYGPAQLDDLEVQAADFNGDGKADLAVVTKMDCIGGEQQVAEIGLSNGRGFVRSAQTLTECAPVPDPLLVHKPVRAVKVGDFDGDGRSDIATLRPVDALDVFGTRLEVSTVFSGQTFLGYQLLLAPEARSFAVAPLVFASDYSGDGKSDVAVAYHGNGDRRVLEVYAPDAEGADLLRRIDNGQGGAVEVAYAAAPLVYGAIVPMSSAPGIPNAAPQQLATQLTTSDGRGGTYRTSFSYSDARWWPGTVPEQRNLGFASVTSRDEQTRQFRSTRYSQTPGFEGQAAGEVVGSGDGRYRTETRHAFYPLAAPNPGTELALEKQQTVEAYVLQDGKPAREFQQVTSYWYDAYGNRTVVSQDACTDSEAGCAPMPNVTITTRYRDPPDWTNWIFGQIEEVETKSGGTTLAWMKNVWDPSWKVITVKREWLDTTNTWLDTAMEYEDNGNLRKVTRPPTGDGLERSTITEYDPTFRAYPVRVTSAGETSGKGHNDDGLVTSVTDANGVTTYTDYDKLGRKIAERRPDGGVTTWCYPSAARPECPENSSYGDPNGQFNLAVSKVDGTRTTWKKEYFDGSGFTYREEATGDDGKVIVVDQQKDPAGRPSSASKTRYAQEGAVWTTTTYDGLGRIATVTTPDGEVSTRDYGFNSETVTDVNGHSTTKRFDGRKRVVAVVDALGQATSYGYDPLGRLTSVTLPDGAVTTLTYDSLNRKRTVTVPQLGTTVYTYDAVGNLVAMTVPTDYEMPTVTYEYGEPDMAYSKGRLTTVRDASGTTRYGYDAMGRTKVVQKTVDQKPYTQGFDYDLLGRATKMTYPEGSAVEYTYKDGGNLWQLWLSLTGAPSTLVAEWGGYSATGKPASATYANLVRTDYEYEVLDQLKRLKTRKGLEAPLQDLGYDWYLAPNTSGINIGSITDHRASTFCQDGSNTSETQTYVHDALYRLRSADGVWGNRYYNHNSIGNPEDFGGMVQRHLVFEGQQVTSGTGLSGVTYDAAGNMRHKVLDGVTWDYAWNAENRLTSVTRNGAVAAQMVYDAGGQRAKKVYSPQGGSSVTTLYVGGVYEKRSYGDGSPERHTIHLLGNGNLVASITRTGAIATAFNHANGWRTEVAAASLYDAGSLGGALGKAYHLLNAAVRHPSTSRWLGGGLFALFAAVLLAISLRAVPKKRRGRSWSPQLRWASLSLALLFTVTACSGGPGGTGQAVDPVLTGDTTRGPPVGTQYYHRNHINSSSVITNESGAESARIVYLPFGEFSRQNSCGVDVVTNKFTGKEFDEETGLYYYGARYYDPAIGRFVSADTVVPSAEAQSFNRYSYVNNNPIVYVDPTGHFLDFIGDFFSAIGRGFKAIGSAIAAGARWLSSFTRDVVDRAWLVISGMFADPASLVATLVSLALTLATGGGSLLANLAMWARAAAAGISAVSIALAAGVNDPMALSLIAVLAGATAVGAASFREYARTLFAWGVNQVLQKVEGESLAKWLAPLNSLAGALIVNAANGRTGWACTAWGCSDPDWTLQVEGEFAFAHGVDVGLGLVLDTDDWLDSGVFVTFGRAHGFTYGGAIAGGYYHREVEGVAVNGDANLGKWSPSGSFDSQCWNGGSIGYGPGAGFAISKTTTWTLSLREMFDSLWKLATLPQPGKAPYRGR